MAANPFSIKYTPSSGKRAAYRAQIEGLHVKVAGRPAVYSATDLSPTGVGISGGTGMRPGETYEIALYRKGQRVAHGITARVVRADSTFAGLAFEDLDGRARDAVHRLVLDCQKLQAEQRKADRLKKS